MSEYKLRGEKTKEVYEIIKRSNKPVSLTELKASSNVNYNTIRGAVHRLVKRGLIKRVGKGVYSK
jgi:predicted transcriptional regulator of viral defense system